MADTFQVAQTAPHSETGNRYIDNEAHLKALLKEHGALDVDGIVHNLVKNIFVASCAVGASYVTAQLLNCMGLGGSEISPGGVGNVLLADESGVATPMPDPYQKSGTSGRNVAMLAGAAIIATKIDPIIAQLIQSVIPMLRDDVEDLRMNHLRLVDETRQQVADSAPDIKRIVSEMDEAIQASLTALRDKKSPPGEPSSAETAKKWMWTRQRFWLGLPDRRRNFFETADMALVKELIDERPKAERREFQLLTSDVIASSALGAAGNRVQVMIWGEPGTGKTRFVKRFTESLQAVNIPFSDTDLQQAMLASHPTMQANSEKTHGHPSGYEIRFQSIRDAIAREGVLNPLIVFEDFPMNTFETPNISTAMLRFCDPDQLPPFSDLTLIVTTNDDPFKTHDFAAKQQNAFRNRFRLIRMEGLDTETHHKITHSAAGDMISKAYAELRPDPREPEATPQPATIRTPFDGERLLEAVTNSAHRILEFEAKIVELNSDPGSRTIKQVVRTMVNHLSVSQYFGQSVQDEAIRETIEFLLTKDQTLPPGFEESHMEDAV